MTTLYLAWQNLQSRLWFPIGRLVQHETEHGGYEFAYVRGAEQAKKLAKFREIPRFPQLYKHYLSDELFSTFRYRVMNRSRTDRLEYLRQLGIDVANWDEITELSVSGGHSQIDNLLNKARCVVTILLATKVFVAHFLPKMIDKASHRSAWGYRDGGGGLDIDAH